MFRKNKNSELELEDYIDEDYDEYFYNESSSEDLSAEEEEYNNFFKVDEDYDSNYVVNTDDEDNYEDFIKVQDDKTEKYYDSIDEDNDSSDEESHSFYTYDNKNIYKFLSIFISIFKWVGVAIAVVLISYFITQGNIKSLLIYILGLVFAFFFGYFFMFILNKFTED